MGNRQNWNIITCHCEYVEIKRLTRLYFIIVKPITFSLRTEFKNYNTYISYDICISVIVNLRYKCDSNFLSLFCFHTLK